MHAQEIAIQLIEDLKPLYQYQHGRWLYRHSNQWHYTNAPRLMIWQAMAARKHAGVVPSPTLADEIQHNLEMVFERQHHKQLAFSG
ncbi:MAG: hypothetical protein ABI690_15025 [Chloroflexota bacterium]